VLISSGDSLCIRELASSVVLNTCFGVDVAADNRLIMIVTPAGAKCSNPLLGLASVESFVHSITINACAKVSPYKIADLSKRIVRLRRTEG